MQTNDEIKALVETTIHQQLTHRQLAVCDDCAMKYSVYPDDFIITKLDTVNSQLGG